MEFTPGMRVRSTVTTRTAVVVGPNPERADMVLVRVDAPTVDTEAGVRSWHVSNIAPR